MGVEKIYSINELYDKIESDRKSVSPLNNRFPIRFIFLNTFEEVKELIDLSFNDIRTRDIANCLSSENTWLTPSDVIEYIKGLSEDTIVLLLSEFLRFQSLDSFYTILKSLTEIEKRNMRIYIPLVGLNERFEQEFWVNFYRKEEWAPVWELKTVSKKIHIYQITYSLTEKSIPLKNFEVVSSTKEWFNIWKKENVSNVISLSKTLALFCKDCLPDQTFDLDVISNQKEYIEKIFDIPVKIEFKKDEEEYWNKLVEELVTHLKEGITLKEIFLKHFNIGNIDKLNSDEIITYYFNTNAPYDQWLVKNFVLSLDKYKNTYLNICFQNLEKVGTENLLEKLWMYIFKIPSDSLDQKIFAERKRILQNLYENFNLLPFEDVLRVELENIRNCSMKTQFMYLTNITCTEKIFILENIENEKFSVFTPDLKAVFPELYYYLNWDLIKPDEEIDKWIIDYLKRYNFSKVKHSESKVLEDILNDKNKNKSTFSEWFYKVPKIQIEKNSHCLWVDGLGAEWFPLITYLINEYGEIKGKSVKMKMITRTNLPSITRCNKHKFEKIDDLDSYIHKQKAYKHPVSLIEEIEIVKTIVRKILSKPYDKISILSDHGFSFLCLKDFDNIKKLPFKDSEHEGRCMKINEEYHDDDYYFVWNTEEGECQDEKFVVASKHVSLNNTPYKEVHGGATPEEVLVPYILIETDNEKIDYNVEPSNFTISRSNPKIEFKIFPFTSHIPEAFIDGRALNVSFDENVYMLNLNFLGVGEHTIDLKIGTKNFKLKVDVKGGFIERDLI